MKIGEKYKTIGAGVILEPGWLFIEPFPDKYIKDNSLDRKPTLELQNNYQWK